MLTLPAHPLHRCLARYAALAMLSATLAATLAACGGGGGSPGTTSGAGSGGGGASVPGASITDPALKLAITDAGGSPVTMLSGGQSGTVRASVTTAAGQPAIGAIVKFSASDTTLVAFTPVSGSALTDAAGVAVITVKPASLSASGALAIKADAVVDNKSASGAVNIAVGAAPLTVGALSFVPAPVGSLPAFSTLSLKIPLTSGGQPVNSAAGLTLSSLCVGDATATLVAGAIDDGVQLATYTNKGCLRGRDTITVAVGGSVQSIGVDVAAANIGTVQFVSSSVTGTAIVLKGSGGLGRSESAQLLFRVVDQQNNGLAGVDVRFAATTYTGGLQVTPAIATTDANGNVSTMVSSGTIPTPVRVTAQASRNGVTISGLSDALTISTGLPIQRSMSMSASSYNIEGRDFDNVQTRITVLMADQYGNPVSDGTPINFVTEGGAVGSAQQGACNTVDGGCTVTLRSQQFRPLNERVTVLAFAQGIPDFTDSNGDGQYSCTSFRAPDGSVPAQYRPLVDTCLAGGEPFVAMGDAFLDAGSLAPLSGSVGGTSTLDGNYDPANGDLPFPYNHAGYSAVPPSSFGVTYIRRAIEIIFSGSAPVLVRQVCSAGTCRDWSGADGAANVIAGLAGSGCTAQQLTFRLADRAGNALPSGTSVGAADADKVTPLTFGPDKVPSTTAIGGTIHSVSIKPDANCAAGAFSVKVDTPDPSTAAVLFPFQSN